MKFPRLFKLATVLLLATSMVACTTLGGLNRHQAKVLKQAGFVYTDEGWTLDMPTSLLFNTDEYIPSQDTQNKIAELMQKLKKINLNKIIVQGHTDNSGSLQHNEELSLKRAQSVAEIALNNGFSTQYVKAIGYADRKPVASNDTEEGRSENRRVAVIIVP